MSRPQVFEVNLMLNNAQYEADNSMQSAWNDALESAASKKEESGNSLALHKNGEMQEWRIICSHEFSESHLSSRPPVNLGRTVTFEAPASILLDKFYSGVPPEHIGAKKDALEKAWLQLAPRLVPDAIALRRILGTPPPGHLLITGGNATGKSTFVSALAWKFRHDRSCLTRTITVKCRDLVGKKTEVVRQELKKAIDDGLRLTSALIIFDDIDALMLIPDQGESENVQVDRLAEDLADMIIESSIIMEQKCMKSYPMKILIYKTELL